jgi:hypothetical protein
MFGTYEEERDDEPVVFGTTHGVQSFDPIWVNYGEKSVHIFPSLGKRISSSCGSIELWDPMVRGEGCVTWKDRLYRFYYGPGWVPGTYAPVKEYSVPHITRETQQKFDPVLSFGYLSL